MEFKICWCVSSEDTGKMSLFRFYKKTTYHCFEICKCNKVFKNTYLDQFQIQPDTTFLTDLTVKCILNQGCMHNIFMRNSLSLDIYDPQPEEMTAGTL